jgi:hypothetical protein
MSIWIRAAITAVLVSALLSVAAGASLVPTSFGFPVIVQNGTTTAFNQDTAQALDDETASVNFPVASDSIGSTSFGPVNLGFPTISQNILQTQAVTHTDFAQTNEDAEFAYPFLGVGGISLPGFGFGF